MKYTQVCKHTNTHTWFWCHQVDKFTSRFCQTSELVCKYKRRSPWYQIHLSEGYTPWFGAYWKGTWSRCGCRWTKVWAGLWKNWSVNAGMGVHEKEGNYPMQSPGMERKHIWETASTGRETKRRWRVWKAAQAWPHKPCQGVQTLLMI